MLPVAPGRLSTTNCWPKLSASFWATMRPTVSDAPPGDCGINRRTGRVGYRVSAACATAGENESNIAAVKQHADACARYTQSPCVTRTLNNYVSPCGVIVGANL